MRTLEDCESVDAEHAVVSAGIRGDCVDLVEAGEWLRYLLRLNRLLRRLLRLSGGAAVFQEKSSFFVLEMYVDQTIVICKKKKNTEHAYK